MKLPKLWLLVLATNLDDVPIGIYPTFEQAHAAITPGKRPKKNPLVAWDDSGPVNWKILPYTNGKWGKVRIFDYETGELHTELVAASK